MNNSAQRLQEITQNIEKCRKKSPLAAAAVTLVAVSKTQSAEAIGELIEAGQKVFGENRVQEAEEKWPGIRERYPDIKLHLIGSLQTNKVKHALQLFDVMHTVDRKALVDAIVKESAKLSDIRCKQFFVQVNTGEEPQKGGVSPAELPELLEYAKQAGLTISGLMCVPPADAVPSPHFAWLHEAAQKFGLPNLSMGMSGDYEAAIRLGATHVRIGTALFGERKY
ncbi:MAG TPA: YggS family pyridoxal phosphate-dependent enzyme [Rickettsiales bacterium]|nr:YggS family pyridoxal phosphate-dependent enzyme [Rickettsiales bacterium]